MILKFVADDSCAGKTVKHILKNRLMLSERLVKKLKYSDRILLNSCPVHVNAPVNSGDVIETAVEFEEESAAIIPEEIPLDIVYEDESVIVINKGPDMVVHPTFGHASGTVANAVMYHLGQKGLKRKIRPVSRLDRDTSGLIIFALNQFVQQALIRQMSEKTFVKEYIGVVYGEMEADSGTIDLPIERKPGSIMLRHVSENGAQSITHYKVIRRLQNATLLKFTLETGRTHQIRVHCQATGHPLIGDTLYGPASEEPVKSEATEATSAALLAPPINRQALHSCRVRFVHPYSGKPIELTAPIPEDIRTLLEILGK